MKYVSLCSKVGPHYEALVKDCAAKTQEFVRGEPWAELNTVVGMTIKLSNPTQ